MPLTDRDRAILEFEAEWRRHAGAKEEAIRADLGLSPARYYQLLGRLIDTAEAQEHDPMLVKRLRRLRDARQQARVDPRRGRRPLSPRRHAGREHAAGGRVASSGAENDLPAGSLRRPSRMRAASVPIAPRTRACAAGSCCCGPSLATIVLVAVGIFGTLLASGRIELFPTPDADRHPAADGRRRSSTRPTRSSSSTRHPRTGLATQMKDVVVAAGWPIDTVLASEAGSTDFPETTVYYLTPEDEAAAAGLAGVIGGAKVAQSDVYQPATTPRPRSSRSSSGSIAPRPPPTATPTP